MDKYTNSLEQLDALILAYRQQLSESPEDLSIQLNLQSLLKLRNRFKHIPENHGNLVAEALASQDAIPSEPEAPEPAFLRRRS